MLKFILKIRCNFQLKCISRHLCPLSFGEGGGGEVFSSKKKVVLTSGYDKLFEHHHPAQGGRQALKLHLPGLPVIRR